MKRAITAFIAAILLAMLGGCATTSLTVDDGRKLDGHLVAEMQAYGEAAAAIRPAIVRTAALNDTDCSVQYELPFEVLTSYGLNDDDAKVAWVRALGVDENLTVIASDPSSGLKPGDIVAQVAGYKSGNTVKMAEALVEARDRGEPFTLQLASGEQVAISPIRICRGHVQIASPFEPQAQGYHWAQSVHPLEVFHQQLSADEAAWIVLWTQGLSELGGARMKTYAFMVGSVKWIAVLGLGFGASSAASSARGAAAAAGTSSAGHVAAVQLAGQAASLMAQSAANRASLSGISGVAAGMFDQADQWAFQNMRKLGMNPYAGLSLHAKLVAQGAAGNAFLMDENRLARMRSLVAGLPDRGRPRANGAAKPRLQQ
jgi:hypothetical protein